MWIDKPSNAAIATALGAAFITELSAERLVDRRRRHREPLRAVRGHVDAVLEPYAEASGNVNARLVREAHAGRQRRGFSVDEVDRFVAVEADTVSGSMRR